MSLAFAPLSHRAAKASREAACVMATANRMTGPNAAGSRSPLTAGGNGGPARQSIRNARAASR